MSATALPLPLQLTQPVTMAADLETLLARSLDVSNTKYDPVTQTRAPEMRGGGTHTSTKCVNHGLIQIDDVLSDIL